MNTALVQQQAALVAALFAVERPHADDASLAAVFITPWHDGILAYRSNGHASAARALAAAYPALRALVSPESFDVLARRYWHHAPPQCGDLARWGAGLAEFLAGEPALADVPYLPDVARAEWALHRAATAADGVAEPASFALLGSTDPAALRLRLSPGAALVSSRWPVASLILAHQSDPPDPLDLREAAALLRAGVSEDVFIWRCGLQPKLRALEETAAARLRAALAGASLQNILDANPDSLDDALGWLASGIQEGWLLGIDTALHATEPRRPTP
ncbi:MAG: hypothetical protein Fur0019_08120 [Tibeticola sp.]